MKLLRVLLSATFIALAAAADLLFVSSLLSFDSYESSISARLGLTSTTVSISQWSKMSTKDFASYKAIIISDPAPGSYTSQIQFLADTANVWGPAVQGNIIIHGTDQSNHGATTLISNSIKFAIAGKSLSGQQQTGLYFSLSQYYDSEDFATVPALSYFGNFTVRGNLDCYNQVHIVASSPAIDNLTDTALSNWECSVHEAFSSYPMTGKTGFQALAIADGVTGDGTQNFAGGHYGLPYIISRGATPAGCGDGHWDGSIGEECDDGNTKDGDGCSRSCKCESGRPTGNGTCYPSADFSGLVKMPDAFIQVDYFTAVYMTVVITVLFKTLWGIVHASSKMIEPFYQLHKETGASAEESLLSGYLSSGLSKESLMNIFRKHWVMTLTSAVLLTATISMMVASEAMTIQSGNSCTTPNDPLQCDLQWVIDVRIARALEILMSLSACMVLVRIILGRRRESGVFSYPCSIASMITLLQHPATVNCFRDIDPKAKSKDVAKALANQRYQIKHFESSPGVSSYGLVLTEDVPPTEKAWWHPGDMWAAMRKDLMFWKSSKEDENKAKSTWKGDIFHILFITAHLAFFGVFLYYRLTANPALFVNKTRNTRWILTGVAVLLGLGWGQIEAEVRIMTPYRRLHKSKSTPKDIVDMPLHGVPITTLFRALWRGNFYHALISFSAVTSDALIVAVVGIPYNFGVIQNVSIFSSTACLGILGFQIVVAFSVFLWRMTNPKMPRKPETIANMIMVLCASRMLQQFGGIEHGPASEITLMNRIEGQQFKFGEHTDVDGNKRLMLEMVDTKDDKMVRADTKEVDPVQPTLKAKK